MPASLGFQATALTQPLSCPVRVSIRWPFSLCQMYIFVSVLRLAYHSKIHLLLLTFTAAEYKVLSSAPKTTPDHKFALVLSFENPNVFSAFHIVEVYFSVSKIDQIRLAILADREASQFCRKRSAIFLLTGIEVEHVEGVEGVEDHEFLPVWAYGTALSTEKIMPGKDWLNARDAPVNQGSLQALR